MDTENDVDDEIVLRANYIFGHLTPPVKCYSVNDIDVSYFIKFYHMLTGEIIPGSADIKAKRAKLTICQFMIDSIADNMLQLPIYHITAIGVIEKDRRVLKDLLDIFIEIMEATLIDSDNESGLGNEGEMIQMIPREIRTALKEIEVGASELVGKIYQVQKIPQLHSQARYTQTTTTEVTSTATSPVTWRELFSEYKKREVNKQRRGKQPSDKAVTHPIRPKRFPVSTIGRKALGSISNITPRTITPVKQKHVVSSKLRRSSPVSKKVSELQKDENLRRSLTLVGELERVRNRRKEITKQTKQLESEDQSLKTLESIMIKELKLSEFTASKESNKYKPVTGRLRKTTIKKPVLIRN